MRLKLRLILLFYIFLLFTYVCGHIPIHVSTPANKIEQFCELADSCVHDTIPICGLMDKEKRTFLDICDMLEYACDHNKIYTHIEDVEGCPLIKEIH
ncbi:uncharacterized protein LOC128678201 [Plodia interpunctella]|uniref:uncharacterized protein LOC128678201 n=1 Tax=Plodia interpunctella TaxID=58824 RepID=UPI0023685575|nr:uncharacterized protein LOC128678201 [Plodia interpunctella]